MKEQSAAGPDCEEASRGFSADRSCCDVKVHPGSGVVEGGTPVTLTGSNLGYAANHTKVTIAGAICTPEPEKYVVSTRYDCCSNSVNCLEHNNY